MRSRDFLFSIPSRPKIELAEISLKRSLFVLNTSVLPLLSPSSSSSMSEIAVAEKDFKTESVSSSSPYISDLNLARRAALAEVDNAAFGWFHVRTCLVAGVGYVAIPSRRKNSIFDFLILADLLLRFFTDAYDLFAISIASVMIGMVYQQSTGGVLTANQDLGLKVAAPVGTLAGSFVLSVILLASTVLSK